MIKGGFAIAIMHLWKNVINKRPESTITKMVNTYLWRILMKACKTKYWPVCILIASFLIWGCASGHKNGRGSDSCDRGQYWSQTAAGCVPLPGP